jgi:Zn-dependent protease
LSEIKLPHKILVRLAQEMGPSMFCKSLTIFSSHGFEFRLDPASIVIAGFMTWSLSQRHFPSVLPDRSGQSYLVMALAAIGLFLCSLLLREWARLTLARRAGVPVRTITLFAFGGVTKQAAAPESPANEIRVALAGPITSLALALGFKGLAAALASLPGHEAGLAVLSYLAMVNLVLGVFNLIPAAPLDGGRILHGYLWHMSKNARVASQRASKSGSVFGTLLMALGVLVLFQGATNAGLWQVLAASFLLLAARPTAPPPSAFKEKTVKMLMSTTPVTVSPDITLSECVNQVMLRSNVRFVPVVESGVLLGHISQALLTGIDRENWGGTRVGDVFAGLDPETTVSPDTQVHDLMAMISRTGRRKFLVVKDQHLAGVITLSDLAQYLYAQSMPGHTNTPPDRPQE